MEFLLPWIIFGIAAGVLAKGKNRNVVLWAFIGLLIGPFALLIVAMMKPAPGPDQGFH
ncbi:hypothetical protein [Geoalkalibacter halelectricus]|uniref:Uncharacterized protein n=1 Tax=Geoalkalibacter halelectricus TaxID=2847045 RepID=A0ABY5ZK74_9BACT|nr:hypothetical protein [Geoalkalibacter halelectricus]MDO3380224.1 hypothetical protein [Geoalkalibacter halelectricus]UWZ78205.1 hypothetical protein L9S41_10890 [Geoalkalibacter halelectricus]